MTESSINETESGPAARPSGGLLALAPLGLALAPALLRLANGPAATTDLGAAQCIHRAGGAVVHAEYLGTGDVLEHLPNSQAVEVVDWRATWKQIRYSSQEAKALGWVPGASVGDCESVPAALPASAAPKAASVDALAGKSSSDDASTRASTGCGGKELSVKFYDVGQALAVLVTLPDGRRVLVDTGEQPSRPGCGDACKEWSDHLLSGLRSDVPDKALALLWITHQHSDHAGNAPAILREFDVDTYVDNGTNLESGIIKRGHAAASERNVTVRVIDPDHRETPLPAREQAKLTPILPEQWVVECEDAPNDCSIGLRIDYCDSSVLFTGDAEDTEEAALDPRGPVTLLQVGHHGSDTSNSAAFIKKVSPKYAVVSSGKEEEGTNTGYCHPRLSTVEALSKQLGSRQTGDVQAFDAAVSCSDPTEHDHWRTVPVSEHLWFTERDGDVELVTTGDGTFRRKSR